MPGVINNLTEKLENLNVPSETESESLLKTIRCPRNLGMITERLPKPQYNMTRRSSSLTASTSNTGKEDKSPQSVMTPGTPS